MLVVDRNDVAVEQKIAELRKRMEAVLEAETEAAAGKLAQFQQTDRQHVLETMSAMVQRYSDWLEQNIRAEGSPESQTAAAILALSLWKESSMRRRAGRDAAARGSQAPC